MRHQLVLIALMAAIGPSLAVAAPAASAEPAVKPAFDDEKLICRKQVETGSLVRGKRVCMTRAEWAKLGDAARDGGQYLIEQNEGKPACTSASTC